MEINTKTKEIVLKFLVDYFRNNQREYQRNYDHLCRDLPKIEPANLSVILDSLYNGGLVTFTYGGDMQNYIELTPTGHEYFGKKKDVRNIKRSDRLWDIIKILIGVIVGSVVTWLKMK